MAEQKKLLVHIPSDATDAEYVSSSVAQTGRIRFSWKKLWAFTGPGWLMSMAYLDPGNLESDLQAGAYTGYQLIWVLFLAIIVGLLLQILAARLGVVTGRNLAQLCQQNYPFPATIILWIMTEIAIIGSDIQEVLGSAIAFKILFGIPLWAGCLITGCDTFTFLGLHFYGMRKLEYLFAVLIFVMVGCFYAVWAKMGTNAGDLLYGWWVPVDAFKNDYATIQAVGILGAVVMPHNIYLHSALVQSRDIDRSNPRAIREAIYYNSIESAVALGVAFLINLAVVAVFSDGFFDDKCASIGFSAYHKNLACIDASIPDYAGSTTYDISDTCRQRYANGQGVCAEIGLQVAGSALSAILKSSGKYLWAVGLLAAGQASTMTGTFAGQYVMEGFLNIRLPVWQRVLLTRTIALGPAIVVAVSTSKNHELSDQLDEWLNVLQSIQLPFAVLPLLLFTSSGRIMGEFKNGKVVKIVTWFLGCVVMATNAYLIYKAAFASDSDTPHKAWFYVIMSLLVIAYVGFIGYLLKESLRNLLGFFSKNQQETQLLENGK